MFGTHNIGSLPVLLERARVQEQAQVEILDSLERFPSVLPARRDSAHSAWVAISVGCNNTCTFCIVPRLRGREEDRRPGDILAEIRALVDDGVLEVTLLGQNVNSYGAAFGDRLAFGKLLRACGEIDGLERVRFTSPHPRDFTDDVIAAMAATPNVMPQLHMPLQSGSDAVLRAMRRAYRRDKYLGILAKVRAAMPDAAITTDIIVGFPGETEGGTSRPPWTWSGGPGSASAYVPVLAAPRHPGRRHGRPGSRRGRAAAVRAAGRAGRGDFPRWPGTRRSPGSRPRSWSRPARAARTRPRTGCPAGPGTTAWCTSRPRAPARAPATWSPP